MKEVKHNIRTRYAKSSLHISHSCIFEKEQDLRSRRKSLVVIEP